MDIQSNNFEIKLSHDELWDLAFYVKDSLEYTIKTHWINHQDVWKKNEQKRLDVIKMMFASLGRHDVYESIFQEVDEIFIMHNKRLNE